MKHGGAGEVGYVILTSKPGQFRTEAGPDAEVVEVYDYLFCGRPKAVFQIVRLRCPVKVRVVEEAPPHVENWVPTRVMEQYGTLEQARVELLRLASFGTLDAALVKRP
jgi:hypothetical protein